MQREDISKVCALDAFLCAAAGKTRRNHENGTTPAATRHVPCSEVCVRCIVRRDRISTPPRPRGQRYGQRDDRSKRLSPPPPQPRRRIYCGNQRLAYLMPLAIGPARSARLLRQGERPRLQICDRPFSGKRSSCQPEGCDWNNTVLRALACGSVWARRRLHIPRQTAEP